MDGNKISTCNKLKVEYCPWEDPMGYIRMKTRETLWSLNQGHNTNTTSTTTITCYMCWSMLLQNDLCCDEVFGLMELNYLQCHIMLSSSKGTYIRIGPFSTTLECNFDVPSKAYQFYSSKWKTSKLIQNLTSYVQLTYFYFFKNFFHS